MQFGTRTFIVPWDHELPEAAQTGDAAIVRLDPGLAFGSGTHPTTALCLRWLDELAQRGELQGRDVLDFGCGSGILALAALKHSVPGDTLATTREEVERVMARGAGGIRR